MTKMADAGVNEIQNMVVRIETLATQASSANNAGELGKLDAERIKLESAIDKIANSTKYNGVNLLNGIDSNAGASAATGTTNLITPAGTGINAIVSISGIYENATFSLVDDATNFLSVTSSKDLLDANGVFLAAAGTELLTANTLIADPANTTLNLIGGGSIVIDTLTGAPGPNNSFDTIGASNSSLYTAALTFQVGADNNIDNQVGIDLTNTYTTTALGLGNGDLSTQSNAQVYIDTAKAALDTLVSQRADLGATQNQISFIQSNLATSIEQTTASVSSIRDADMAAEMAMFTKNQILTQASTSMLAQANQAAQNVMTLFR